MDTNFYDKNLKKIKNGDIMMLIAPCLPLLLWIYYIIKVPLPWISKQKSLGQTQVFLAIFCISLPFVVIIYNFFNAQYKTDYNFNTAELTPGWQFCLDTKNISTDEQKKGLIARWDLKCGLSQIGLNSNIVKDIVTRFYYLSNALFIFVLVIYNSLSVDILQTKHITQTIIFCLLLGIIGMLPSIFNTYYLKTFLFNRMISTILSMNIAAFFLLILGILIRIKKH